MEVRKVCCAELIEHPAFAALCDEYAAESGSEYLGEWAVARETYRALEAQGRLRVLMLMADGVLAGFAALLRIEPTHYAESSALMVDALFVSRGARAGGGRLLLRELCEMARDAGACLYVSAKPGTRAHRLYERIARPVSTMFILEGRKNG